MASKKYFIECGSYLIYTFIARSSCSFMCCQLPECAQVSQSCGPVLPVPRPPHARPAAAASPLPHPAPSLWTGQGELEMNLS